ncbi:MAG TPA: hypothetical protein VJA87_02875 [Candidatus Paceibacterota bacterium]
MRTDFPTTELYFVFAFTFCKLTVYTDQEPFARKILEAKDVEFLESSESYDWQEWDTRLLLAIVSETLPNLISKNLPRPQEAATSVLEAIGVKAEFDEN